MNNLILVKLGGGILDNEKNLNNTISQLHQLIQINQNIDKIIHHIEELSRKKEEHKRAEKRKKVESTDKRKKEGWRKILPF